MIYLGVVIRICIFLAFLIMLSDCILAEQSSGSIKGMVVDVNNKPLTYVSVAVTGLKDNFIVCGTHSDKNGYFRISNIPFGEYKIKLSMIGYEEFKSKNIIVDKNNQTTDLGPIILNEQDVNLKEVTVSSQNDIVNFEKDKKVYNVQNDLISKNGTLGDLIQNLPSVTVEVDGSVNLRGSSNVQILINGKSTPLTSNGISDLFQQIPANSIEKIEIITNPTAKYKPDGGSGIINIVLKNDSDLGLNANIGANLGNSWRYNLNAGGNYKLGAFNINGNYSFRQDERNIFTWNHRAEIDKFKGFYTNFDYNTMAHNRPYTNVVTLGIDYFADSVNKIGFSGNVRARRYTSHDTTNYTVSDFSSILINNYDRLRTDYDQTTTTSLLAYYEHDFSNDDHKIRSELNFNHMFDEEDNRFDNVYKFPALTQSYDNTLIREWDNLTELTVDYSNKLNKMSKIDAGFDNKYQKNEFPFFASYKDAFNQDFISDTGKTNHFIFVEKIYAVYTNYEQDFGNFGALGGVRFEYASISSNLVNKSLIIQNDYIKIYPTIHLSYKLNETNELQLNYSLRTDRPDGSDLNPFPEYRDPKNIRAGNPNLKPEFIHSIELGYQYQNDLFTCLPGIFYKNRFNGFTYVTKTLENEVILTTIENLAKDQSGGIEFILSGSFWKVLNTNIDVNGFYEEIDAANLGYSGVKRALSWSGSMNINANLAKGTMLQVNSNYRSVRLTPQGEIKPAFVLNFGLKQDFFDGKLTLSATITDVLATLKRETSLNTEKLILHSTNSRDSRVIFCGLIYHFGIQPQKAKDKTMDYDSGS